MSPSEPQTRPISSIAIAYASVSSPAPPSSSGNGMPSQPSAPMRLHDLDREASLALVLVDDRGDLGQHEVPDRVAQEDMLRGEVEVHRSERTTGTTARGDRC